MALSKRRLATSFFSRMFSLSTIHFKHPDLPPDEHPVALNQIQLDQFVHVLGKSPEGDGLFLELPAFSKIRFPQLPGVYLLPWLYYTQTIA